MGRNKAIAAAVLALIFVVTASQPYAAEFGAAISYFDTPVDFWGYYQAIETPSAPPPSEEKARETEPDNTEAPPAGALALPGQNAPAVARRFLSDPTKENAIKFLDWFEERVARAARASQVLEQVIAEREQARAVTADHKGYRTVDWLTIYYFFSPRCRYCLKQSPIVEKLYRETKYRVLGIVLDSTEAEMERYVKHAGLTFPVKMDGGESGKFRIDSYPTIVFANRVDMKAYRLQGLSTMAEIRKGLAQALADYAASKH